MAGSNPFAVNRVGASTFKQEDARHIHHRAFGELTDLVGRAGGGPAIGAVLWGEAGIGKSHLLARLERWAKVPQERAVLVYIANLQAEPARLPRALLRHVVHVLLGGRTRH